MPELFKIKMMIRNELCDAILLQPNSEESIYFSVMLILSIKRFHPPRSSSDRSEAV
jgi:hypothetical protein